MQPTLQTISQAQLGRGRILIIDDDIAFGRTLQKLLEREGYEAIAVFDGLTGLEKCAQADFDIVLCDYMMPNYSGLDVLKAFKEKPNSAIFLIMTAYGTVDLAVETVKAGAYDYIVKSANLDEFQLKIKKALELIALQRDLAFFQKQEMGQFGFQNIIGACPAMQRVFERIRGVAETPQTTVFIHGESGTGKELVARAIHTLSLRSRKPFIEIDCTTIPGPLLESELFGYERGAFTGAERTKIGLIEQGSGGTIFFDEIGDLDLALQAKLLRLLQERKIRRVGGVKDIPVDIRFIAATNRDLATMAHNNHFREDLLYRLKVFTVDLPPLRERGDDIALIAKHLLGVFNREFKKNVIGFDADFHAFLKSYPFPGNIRELRNYVEQGMILAKSDMLTAESLPIAQHEPFATSNSVRVGQGAGELVLSLTLGSGGDLLDTAEKALIDAALDSAKGNQSQAAQLLGISRHALRRRMEKFGYAGLTMQSPEK